MNTTTFTGTDAIDFATRTGAQLHKHADPVDGAREVTLDEARAIAREDVGLVWCETAHTLRGVEAKTYSERFAIPLWRDVNGQRVEVSLPETWDGADIADVYCVAPPPDLGCDASGFTPGGDMSVEWYAVESRGDEDHYVGRMTLDAAQHRADETGFPLRLMSPGRLRRYARRGGGLPTPD